MMRSLSNLLSTLEAQIGPAGLVGVTFGLAALLGLIFGISLMGIISAARQRRAIRESQEEQELMQNLLNDTRMQSSRLQSENDALQAKVDGAIERDTQHDREFRQLSTELKAAHMSLETKDNELLQKNSLLHDQSVAAAGERVNQQSLDTAVQDALEKGRNEGLKTGLKDGREQGRSEGLEAGLKQGREEARTKATTERGQVHAPATAVGLGAAAGAAGTMGLAKASEPPTLVNRVRSGDEGSLNTTEAGIIKDDQIVSIPDDQIIPTLPEAELTANVEAYDLSDLEDLVNEDL